MLLSIGMIVKNEEKYLEKCLTALKPILENVDSELIIADTGSTDSTVEIAKKFTDNVFHFEWINDFAAARNSTLDRAKGEWYMFLDADEIIQDCTELIEFFNSGEYKNYGSGTITVRNYNDLQNMDLFSDANLPRLTALENGVRFAKPIHENFDKSIFPRKNFKTIADHYGYVYRDGDKILDTTKIKTSRNLELLFQELEEGKKSGEIVETTYGQIADCYMWLGELEKAMEYIELGIENCNPKSYSNISYYNKKIRVLSRMGQFEKVIDTCSQYFSKDNFARNGQRLVTDSSVYFFWAAAAHTLGKYDEVINKTVLGMDVYRSYHNGKLFTPELNYCTVETTIPMLKQVCNMFLDACIKQKRYSDALSQLPNIPLDDFLSDVKFMKSHLEIRTAFMDKTNYNKLPDLYYQLDKPNRALYIKILMNHIFRTERYEHFLKKLSLIKDEDDRLADAIKLYESYFIHHRLTPRMTNEFIKKHGVKDNEAIWILMMKNSYDITPFVSADDFDPTTCVEDVYLNVSQVGSVMDLFLGAVDRISEEGVDKALTAFEKAVYSATDRGFDTIKVIRAFCKLAKRWVKINPNAEQPESVKFALVLNEADALLRKKRYDDTIAKLEELIGDEPAKPDDDKFADASETSEGSEKAAVPNAAEPEKKPEPVPDGLGTQEIKVLRQYLRCVSADKDKSADLKEKQDENPALAELAEQIKQEIRVMIEAWDLDGAEEALNSMARMVPFDPDIEDIRDEITDRKVNYMNYM